MASSVVLPKKSCVTKEFASSSEQYECVICAGAVEQRHRGIVACNAFAAFFRR